MEHLIDPVKLGEDSRLLENAAEEFRNAAELLTAYGAAEQIQLQPYRSPELSLFRKLPLAQATQIADGLKEYCKTLAVSKENGEYLRYNLNSVWLTLRKTRLRAEDDLFTQLEPHDVVEIYTLKGVQIYRSFHFFQYCSYDLETIFCLPWYELYARDAAIDAAYMDAFHKLATGEIKGTIPVPVDVHIVRERLGRRTTKIAPRIFSPLTDEFGTPWGFVHAFRAISADA